MFRSGQGLSVSTADRIEAFVGKRRVSHLSFCYQVNSVPLRYGIKGHK